MKKCLRILAFSGFLLTASAAFAGGSPTGTDPDPGPDPPHAIHILLEYLGL